MRLFTAISLPPDILLRLERLIVALRPEAQLKWSPLDNLHITTKFIGSWPVERLDEVKQVLTAIEPPASFPVLIKGLGWFPHARSPRVFWAGVEGGPVLEDLARRTESALFPLGIAKESRPYSPHLTLARISHPVPLEQIRQRVEPMRDAEMGSFTASSFHLYSSQPGTNASTYRKLAEYPLLNAVQSASAGSKA